MANEDAKWNEFLALKKTVQEFDGSLAEIESGYEKLKVLAAEVAPGFLMTDEPWAIEQMLERERNIERLRKELGRKPTREDLIVLLENTFPPKTEQFDGEPFDAALTLIAENVPYPNFDSLLGPLERGEKTATEVIDEALAYQPTFLEGPGFVIRR